LKSFDSKENDFFSSSSSLGATYERSLAYKRTAREPTYCDNSRNPEYIINCLLSMSLEFGPGHWSLGARRALGQDNFGRHKGMLACEPSKAPTTLSRPLEVMSAFEQSRHLQVGLLFNGVLEKKAEMEHSTY
jgi:hypothetical protein